MKPKKILGWALLVVGLLLIFWILYSTYNIFTGKTLAPEIFKMEKKETVSSEEKDEADYLSFEGTPEEASEKTQEEMKKMVEEQMREMVPSEFMSKILNLISWSILAGILIFGGSKISGIGIKLVKES